MWNMFLKVKGQCHEFGLLDLFCVNKLYTLQYMGFRKNVRFCEDIHRKCVSAFSMRTPCPRSRWPTTVFSKKNMCLQKIFIAKIKNCVSDTTQL